MKMTNAAAVSGLILTLVLGCASPTEEIEAPRVAPLQMGFSKTVALLLSEITADGWAAMMPDEGTGVINNLLIGHEQSPAQIDVVSRSPMFGVEGTDQIERFLAKSHIAARDVLSPFVVDHDAGWITRGLVYALGGETVLGWRKVRATYSHGPVFLQSADQVE